MTWLRERGDQAFLTPPGCATAGYIFQLAQNLIQRDEKSGADSGVWPATVVFFLLYNHLVFLALLGCLWPTTRRRPYISSNSEKIRRVTSARCFVCLTQRALLHIGCNKKYHKNSTLAQPYKQKLFVSLSLLNVKVVLEIIDLYFIRLIK